MNFLRVCLSWLGALFLLTIVATGVLGSIAYDWFKRHRHALEDGAEAKADGSLNAQRKPCVPPA